MKLEDITITISSNGTNTGKTTIAALIANALSDAGIKNVSFQSDLPPAAALRHMSNLCAAMQDTPPVLHDRKITIVETSGP